MGKQMLQKSKPYWAGQQGQSSHALLALCLLCRAVGGLVCRAGCVQRCSFPRHAVHVRLPGRDLAAGKICSAWRSYVLAFVALQQGVPYLSGHCSTSFMSSSIAATVAASDYSQVFLRRPAQGNMRNVSQCHASIQTDWLVPRRCRSEASWHGQVHTTLRTEAIVLL